MISTVPALGLYLLGVLLSPNLNVVWETWDLPFRILAASAVLVVPTGSLALCLSSMTQETRYAGFAWFAVWILGWFTYVVMMLVEAFSTQQPPSAMSEINGLVRSVVCITRWAMSRAGFSGSSEFSDVAGLRGRSCC